MTAVRERLKADPVIREIADEMASFDVPRDTLALPSGALRGSFMMRAAREYERRCGQRGRRPIRTLASGPAQAILELLDEARA